MTGQKHKPDRTAFTFHFIQTSDVILSLMFLNKWLVLIVIIEIANRLCVVLLNIGFQIIFYLPCSVWLRVIIVLHSIFFIAICNICFFIHSSPYSAIHFCILSFRAKRTNTFTCEPYWCKSRYTVRIISVLHIILICLYNK